MARQVGHQEAVNMMNWGLAVVWLTAVLPSTGAAGSIGDICLAGLLQAASSSTSPKKINRKPFISSPSYRVIGEIISVNCYDFLKVKDGLNEPF
jgi:hypothetical protein